MPHPWAAEDVETLRTLALVMSDTEIGTRLGRSRKSIAIKRANLGIRKTEATALLIYRGKMGSRIAAKPKAKPFAGFGLVFAAVESAVTIIDLREHHCRWPHDCDDGVRYCGEVKADLDPLKPPYCGAHRALSWTPRRAA